MEIIPHSYSAMAQVQCPFDPSSFQDFNFYPGVGRCTLRVPESVKLGVVASDAQCLCSPVGQETVNWRGNCDGQRYLLGFLASFLGLGGHIAKQTDSTAIMQLWKSQLLNPVQDLWAHGATSFFLKSFPDPLLYPQENKLRLVLGYALSFRTGLPPFLHFRT